MRASIYLLALLALGCSKRERRATLKEGAEALEGVAAEINRRIDEARAPAERRDLERGMAEVTRRASLAPLEPEQLRDPERLGEILRRDLSRAHELGGARWRISGLTRLTAGGDVYVRLEEAATLALAESGDFFATREATAWTPEEGYGPDGGLMTHTRGARAAWIEGRYYTGVGYGPMSARPLDSGAHLRRRDEALEPLIGPLLLYIDAVEIEVEEGPTTLGRDALQVILQRARRAFDAPKDLPRTDEARAPRERGRPPYLKLFGHPRRLDARLLLDAETGIPLGGRIDALIEVMKDETLVDLEIKMEMDIEALEGEVGAIVDPRPFAPRARPFYERARLVGEALARGDHAQPPDAGVDGGVDGGAR